MFTEAKPDLVTTDLVLPEKSGLGVLTDLPAKSPPLKAIARSEGRWQSEGDDLAAATHPGAAKVFSQPFSFETLIVAINEMADDLGARTTA